MRVFPVVDWSGCAMTGGVGPVCIRVDKLTDSL